MSRISYNSMVALLIDRSECGESSKIGFYKATAGKVGEFCIKDVLYGAPKTNLAKHKTRNQTESSKSKSLIKKGKIALTEVGSDRLLTPYTRLIVQFENKEVWH